MTATSVTQSLIQIPIDAIAASKYQARKSFDTEALQGLAESMRQEGIIEPIIVRAITPEPRAASFNPIPLESFPMARSSVHTYELIAGERRLRAARLLGWKTILARVISTVSEGEAAAKGLIENLQREDLNPIEEAEAFDSLNKVDPAYWSQDRIARATGKTPTYISRSLQILTLPEAIKNDLRCRKYSRNHGIELARLPGERIQLEIAAQIQDKLTVIETRRIVDSILIRGGSHSGRLHVRQTDVAPSYPSSRGSIAADPLSDLWSKASAGSSMPWKVQYQNGGWNFWVKNPSSDTSSSREALAAWLKSILQQLTTADSNKKQPH